MPTLDDEIDSLYQGPLAEFTTARNELAKRAGVRADDIRALPKPTAAAWAVNQLYWRHRQTFDALARASETKRAVHVAQLRGKTADVAAADVRHRRALDKAADATRVFLKNAGDSVSSATRDAIMQTLEAIPSPDIQGRLARPVESVGFSPLAALMASAGPPVSPHAPAEVVVMKTRGRGRHDARPAEEATRTAKEARVAEARRRRERVDVARALEVAEAAERDATTALVRARHALEQAQKKVDRLEADLHDARAAVDARRDDADRARLAVNDAAAARVNHERRLATLED